MGGKKKKKYGRVTVEEKALLGRIQALSPDRRKDAMTAINKAEAAEAQARTDAEKRRIAAQRKKILKELEARAQADRVRRAKIGVVNPGTIFKFSFKGKQMLGITTAISPDQFNSIDDVRLVAFVFTEGDMKKARGRGNKILTRRNIDKGHIVGGWKHQRSKQVQEVMEA